MNKSYPEKYAIAVKDSQDLFLMFVINRSSDGDIYVNFNKRDDKHNPHSSYHASGQLHHKSYNKKLFPLNKKQPPKNRFSGSEAIIQTSIQKGEGRAWNRVCVSYEYQEIMEIKDENIIPEFGYQLIFEVVEPHTVPWISTNPYAKLIQQHFFKTKSPWIVVTLYEMSIVPHTK
jgi:hypothetical protein